MDKDMPADWAIERALAESGNPFDDKISEIQGCANKADSIHQAFARYIEAHEQPPVDPDLVTAREICARVCNDFGQTSNAKAYRDGDYDSEKELQFALAKLKEARGK